MNKFISKLILNITSKTKPILIKIFPIEFLRNVKRKFINNQVKNNISKNRIPFDKDKSKKGINLVGFIKGEIGLGQSCRLLADAIDNSGIEFTIYNYEQVSSMRQSDKTWEHKISNTTPYGVNLFHINPPDMILANIMLDKTMWDTKYNIGFWLWELEKFPEDWREAFSLVDEIWTPSEHITNIMRQQTDLPVRTMIYPITTPTDKNYDRKYFNLPKGTFLYLSMYDCNSTIERKNPIGAIEAFKKSFSPETKGVGLVIKINNPQKNDIDKILKLCEGYTNIYLIDRILTKVEVNSLIKEVDVLISLHRAEGFGLPLAEAMTLGTPTIATNWSSNTEFMDDSTACLVDYKMIELKDDYAMYKAGSKWADPDINSASKYIIKLFENRAFYDNISVNAKQFMETNYNQKIAGKAVQKRIQEIYEENI